MKNMKSGQSLRKISVWILMGIMATQFVTAATAEERILIFGDSLMKLVSRSIEKQVDRDADIKAISIVSIGSGLARLDLFDWEAKISKAVKDFKPTVAVAMIGANDNQPMMTDSGTVQLGTPEWEAEYERRVGRMIEILTEGGVGEIYWIGLPDMRDSDLQKEVQRINSIVVKRARKNNAVEYIDTIKLFSRDPGKFSPYIIDKKTAMPIHVRASDGVHLNRKGADMLADMVVDRVK